mmetsp:Transcript_6978/g.20513  ORF Transcript_6978/g.20513 Transcript_6978/m.20513 type:complete len:282 (+) Transcript_6978:859-1704(+)
MSPSTVCLCVLAAAASRKRSTRTRSLSAAAASTTPGASATPPRPSRRTLATISDASRPHGSSAYTSPSSSRSCCAQAASADAVASRAVATCRKAANSSRRRRASSSMDGGSSLPNFSKARRTPGDAAARNWRSSGARAAAAPRTKASRRRRIVARTLYTFSSWSRILPRPLSTESSMDGEISKLSFRSAGSPPALERASRTARFMTIAGWSPSLTCQLMSSSVAAARMGGGPDMLLLRLLFEALALQVRKIRGAGGCRRIGRQQTTVKRADLRTGPGVRAD